MPLPTRPDPSEIPAYYHGYVDNAGGDDLFEALARAQGLMHGVLARVEPERENHRYAVDKWSIREVLQHVIDAERVFAYRALRFGRGDATPLPGFEENDYVPTSKGDQRPLTELVREYDAVRSSTLLFFRGLPAEAFDRSGQANGQRISVRALGWVIAGHSDHHARIIAERYLDKD